MFALLPRRLAPAAGLKAGLPPRGSPPLLRFSQMITPPAHNRPPLFRSSPPRLPLVPLISIPSSL
jgi:hypothetical protein